MTQCPNGHDNSDGSRFCSTCGTEIASSTDTPSTVEQAPFPASADDSGEDQASESAESASSASSAISEESGVSEESQEQSAGRGKWIAIGIGVVAVLAVLAVIVAVSAGGGGFDSDTASDEEKFEHFKDRVAELGGDDPSMTFEESLEVAENFCDNDADEMIGMVGFLLMIDDLANIRPESIAKAEAYCPDALPLVEAAVGDTADGLDPADRIRGLASSLGLEDNVSSEGDSISFDTEGEEDSSGDSYFDVTVFLEALEAPDRVTQRIASTRALDCTGPPRRPSGALRTGTSQRSGPTTPMTD